jgi:DNA processing protein
MGCGLARVYPSEHKRLAEEVARSGFLCSEFPLDSPPLARHFPMRNRIIAGLVSAVVVVEGALRSGSLITARLGADMGRYVFALPGGVDNGLARGPHAMIREGAILAEGPEDVLFDLGYRPLTEEREVELPEDPLQRSILEQLSETEPRGLDAILVAQKESAPAVLAALTSLELADRIRMVEGRRYVKRLSGGPT